MVYNNRDVKTQKERNYVKTHTSWIQWRP